MDEDICTTGLTVSPAIPCWADYHEVPAPAPALLIILGLLAIRWFRRKR